jgi:hypothetical protein
LRSLIQLVLLLAIFPGINLLSWLMNTHIRLFIKI